MIRKNILVIDDEPAMLESLEELFGDDFNVFKAGGGKEGLRLLENARVDLVLLDLKLAETDGTEVLKSLRRFSAVPVIVMTAYSTIEWAERCADLAVQGYIKKPFDPDDMLEKVRAVLGERRGTGQVREGGSMDGLSPRIRKAVRIIGDHYTESIRTRDVAAQVFASRDYLGKKFKHETGHSIDEKINVQRVEKAKHLLLEKPDARLSEIAEEAGFGSERQFRRVFKRHTGMTPAAFKKSPA
jgi:YesN/AraC family two-component response regulator